jgi:hypothetical protein
MAQKPQLIDLTKSFIPGDPNSVPVNLVSTDREDGEEQVVPVLPIEGYNFLPSSYSYKGYFGVNSPLFASTLPARAQHVLLFQSFTYKNMIIALCEDGIWAVDPNQPGSIWTRLVTKTYDPQIFQEWTYCVIENILYMYMQGDSQVHTLNAEDF